MIISEQTHSGLAALEMSAFKLSKWYLDSITPTGDTVIGYTGSIAWGPVHLNYSSCLNCISDRVTTSQTLRRQREPYIENFCLHWSSKHLSFNGIWLSGAKPLQARIYDSPAGSIDWRCIHPRACSVVNGNHGLGYAEHLSMTLPPWQFPIQTLRWGRFLSESDWIVWITCRGEYSFQVLYRNGELAVATSIKDDIIVFRDGACLTLDRGLTLRQGPLGTTALSKIPKLSDTFPARLLNLDECKWRSRAVYSCGQSQTEGWAIHEVVRWPA